MADKDSFGNFNQEGTITMPEDKSILHADEIVTKKISIVDDNGGLRMLFDVESECPAVAILDSQGRDAIFITVQKDGKSFISLRDCKGYAIATIMCDRDGAASVSLIDGTSGVPAFVCSVDGNGGASINCEYRIPKMPG